MAYARARLPGRRAFPAPLGVPACARGLHRHGDSARRRAGGARSSTSRRCCSTSSTTTRRLKRWRDGGIPPRDPLVDALIRLPPPGRGRAELVRTCLPVTRNRRINRDVAFGKLVDELCGADAASIPDGLCVDLLVWLHLSWLGETLRGDPRAAEQLRRGGDFRLADRRSLLDLTAEGVAAVIPRWRALAERGSVELSTTPYYHPRLPLLLDFSSACDTAPGTAVPGQPYPCGAQRARWHLQEGLVRAASSCSGSARRAAGPPRPRCRRRRSRSSPKPASSGPRAASQCSMPPRVTPASPAPTLSGAIVVPFGVLQTHSTPDSRHSRRRNMYKFASTQVTNNRCAFFAWS